MRTLSQSKSEKGEDAVLGEPPRPAPALAEPRRPPSLSLEASQAEGLCAPPLAQRPLVHCSRPEAHPSSLHSLALGTPSHGTEHTLQGGTLPSGLTRSCTAELPDTPAALPGGRVGVGVLPWW